MSPVYEHAYEAWEGDLEPRWRRVAAIAGQELGRVVSSTWVWLLWIATLVHVAIRGFVLWASAQFDVPAEQLPPGAADQIRFTEGFLANVLGFQAGIVLLLMLALVAAGVLARDLDAGALTFYFSKPITRTGYAAAKLSAPVIMGLTVTALPLLVLWVLGVAFTPEALHPDTVASLPLRLLAAGGLVSLAASLVAVAISGLVRSTNIAAGVWVALALISKAAAGILAALAGEPLLEFVDLFHAFRVANDSVLGLAVADDELAWAWGVTAGWILAGAGTIAHVLRSEEVGG